MTESFKDAVSPDLPAAFPLQGGGEPEGSRSFLSAAPRLLRGRYGWAIGLGLVLAAAGGIAGIKGPKPLYKSVGLIDVAPKVNRVLYSDVDEKGLLPMFDAFVASQAALASTRRVIDMAMASEEWKRFGRGTSDSAVAAFQGQLEVTHPRYTQHVEVSFIDPDPDAAQTATNQVIAAYMKIVKENEDVSGLSTATALENQRVSDGSKLTDLRANVLSVTEGLGEQAIEARYAFAISELNKFDAVLSDVDLQIASAKAAGDSKDADRPMTEQEIALRDPAMDQLLLLKGQAERRVAVFATQLGEKHPDLVAARSELEAISGRLKERLEAFRQFPPGTLGRIATLREQEAHRARVAALRDEAQDEIKRLGKQKLQLRNLASEIEHVNEQLEQVKKRQDQISIESEVHGRISVIAYGDRPAAPDTDRRIPLALLGAVGGLALGFGVVMAWGAVESKLRHLTDVADSPSRGKFLGVLPDLDDKNGRLAAASIGASGRTRANLGDYCVHHVRTMLQLRKPKQKLVVCVTSPSPRAGKTTLGLGLGMSFATTQKKTLLVDCDFVGHGTTTALRALVASMTTRSLLPVVDGQSAIDPAAPDGAHPLMAALLAQRAKVPKPEEFERLLSDLEELADSGDEDARKRLHSIVNLQHPRSEGVDAKTAHGVRGVMLGRPIEECVVDIGVPNLSVLPVGDANEQHAMNLSPDAVETLVAACRARYDLVLIDTGPVLGSIEAAFVAAPTNSDQVVLVIPRNEKKNLVDQALQRLAGVRADVAGVVFNRATALDIETSNYSCSQSQAVG